MAVVRLARKSLFRTASGYVKTPIKADVAPHFCVDATGEHFGSIPDILKSHIKWRESETHEVGRPEIAYHTAFDHRLDDRIALIEGYPNLATAQ